MKAIGLMSGTSMDGIDVALLETDGDVRVAAGGSAFVPYTTVERALLRAAIVEARSLTDRAARPGSLRAAEDLVTARHAGAVETFIAAHHIDRDTIDVVGFHGQTVLHRPEQRLTVQIGDGAVLAERLGLKVVADLRAADVAAGGQGAPLVPVFHQALARASALPLPLLVINIGGVANITFVPVAGDPIACDTGPGNALLDDLMLERMGEPCDRDGATAAMGRVHDDVLALLMAHPFFDVPPPKSLDRNDFSREPVAALSVADAAATLTAFTAASIARSLDHLPLGPRQAVVCGGGAHNPTLMAALAARLPCPVIGGEVCGWEADAIEAQAFAYLAVRSLNNRALTFPGTTGVKEPLSGGRLFSPGEGKRPKG